MKYCPNCGTENLDHAFACVNCGTCIDDDFKDVVDQQTPLRVNQPKPQPKPQQPQPQPQQINYQQTRQQPQPQPNYQQPQPQPNYQQPRPQPQPQANFQPPQPPQQPPQYRQQPAAAPAAPAAAPASFNVYTMQPQQVPPEYKPLSPWAYFGYSILYSIPILGFIMLIVFSLSNDNINRRNHARSFFCGLVLAIILGVITGIILAVTGFSIASLGNYLR